MFRSMVVVVGAGRHGPREVSTHGVSQAFVLVAIWLSRLSCLSTANSLDVSRGLLEVNLLFKLLDVSESS